MLVIGDVHGKLGHYLDILNSSLNESKSSICVGDFGFKKEHDWFIKNINSNLHYINFGNHDYYPYLEKDYSTNNCSFFKLNEDNIIFTIRGAYSIDQQYRRSGIDWFENEEIPYTEWFDIFESVYKYKPEIIISHDCPQFIKEYLFGYFEQSLTNQALDNCWRIHKPKLWIFGHHHESKELKFYETKFVCLNELETLDLENYIF